VHTLSESRALAGLRVGFASGNPGPGLLKRWNESRTVLIHTQLIA